MGLTLGTTHNNHHSDSNLSSSSSRVIKSFGKREVSSFIYKMKMWVKSVCLKVTSKKSCDECVN